MTFVPTAHQRLALKRFQHDIETAGIVKDSDGYNKLSAAFICIETLRTGDGTAEADFLEGALFEYAKLLASRS